MINLGRRMQKIAEQVSHCDILADIGSDHGILPAYLLQNKIIKYAVITDISKKNLLKAQKRFCGENSEDAVFICTDGLKGVDKKINTVIIAGMGGMEIIKILKEAPQSYENYIFQPMKNTATLRIFLFKNGFKILTDFIIKDGRNFYDIIKAVKGKDDLTEEEILLGKTNLKVKSPDFYEFLIKQNKITEKLYTGLDKNSERSVQLFNYLNILKKYINNREA